jgi:hypothetical protein
LSPIIALETDAAGIGQEKPFARALEEGGGTAQFFAMVSLLLSTQGPVITDQFA